MKLLTVRTILIQPKVGSQLKKDYLLLKESIKRIGLIEPIVVTQKGYEILHGFGRYVACKELGYLEIECWIFEGNQDEAAEYQRLSR